MTRTVRDAAPLADGMLALTAVQDLRRARTRLAALAETAASAEDRRHIVQGAADRLATRATDSACSAPLAAILLDWRDRLSSHILASRALADLDVHRAAGEQLLQRGLDDAIDEAPRRLAALRREPTPAD